MLPEMDPASFQRWAGKLAGRPAAIAWDGQAGSHDETSCEPRQGRAAAEVAVQAFFPYSRSAHTPADTEPSNYKCR